nr:peptidoglycan DD-metalloendopeptidase family protein [uncultured Neokomagataea sp.]
MNLSSPLITLKPSNAAHYKAAPLRASPFRRGLNHGLLIGTLLLGGALSSSKAQADAHHHKTPHHKAPVTPPTAGQRALAEAIAARKALEAKEKAASEAIATQQQAARTAQSQAVQDQTRAKTYVQQSRTKQAALNTTQRRIQNLEGEIASLQAQRTRLQQAISAQNRALSTFLPVLLHVSQSPNAALFTAPQSAPRAATTLAILDGMTRLTHNRADTLRTQQTQLGTLSQTLTDREAELDTLRRSQTRQATLAATRSRRAIIQSAHSQQSAADAQRSLHEAQQNAAALSNAVAALAIQEAHARAALEAEARRLARAHQLAQARAAQARVKTLSPGEAPHTGGGHAPVTGPIVTSWGQETEAGPATGVTYAPAPLAAVHAPCSGQIEFAGPFRSFGQMLILHCGSDYRFVLAGLGTISVRPGSSVKQAATLGQMPSEAPHLFVQLHRDTRTISPLPFL